ncbi:MAG: bacteriohemerythrin [Desulfuromonadaceae bacterium]|nr:bacteriohemerythrin [Desulfuromonadaceae bacterium]
MLKIEWDRSMEIGIPKIDAQHQGLFDLIKTLDGTLHYDAGTEEVSSLISTLNRYAIEHFTEEEMMMLSFHYPDLVSHRMLHDQFVSRLEGIQRDFDDGHHVTENITDFLMDWLITHIFGVDQEYKRFMSLQSL